MAEPKDVLENEKSDKVVVGGDGKLQYEGLTRHKSFWLVIGRTLCHHMHADDSFHGGIVCQSSRRVREGKRLI